MAFENETAMVIERYFGMFQLLVYISLLLLTQFDFGYKDTQSSLRYLSSRTTSPNYQHPTQVSALSIDVHHASAA